jgi:hypothetical protein
MKNKRPECFGQLDQVFPMTMDGLRHSPDICKTCVSKPSCLRVALAGGNRMLLEEEKLDRAYRSGRIGFLQRWLGKKAFHHRRAKEGMLARQALFLNDKEG